MSALRPTMSRWRTLVLGGWVVGVGLLLAVGRYTLFIRAQLWPLLLASAVILAGFVVATLARPDKSASRRVPLAGWIRGGMLLLPLAYMCSLMTGAAASGLNSFALQKRSLGLSSASDSFAIAGASDAPLADTTQTLNLGYVARHLDALAGRHIVTDGRVFRDDSLPNGQIAIFRFVVVCCAADAMPIELVVQSPLAANLKNDDWVRVGGKLRIDTQDGKRVPVIDADAIDTIPAPDQPYLSPYQF